jgi:hypothetical protein
MNEPEPVDIRYRHFVTVATSKYQDFPELKVEKEVAALRSWLNDENRLGERAFTSTFDSLGNDPSAAQITESFDEARNTWNGLHAAFVFITGHGLVEEGYHRLVLSDSEPGNLANTALQTSAVIRKLLDSRDNPEHVLLIVDACFSGALFRDLSHFEHLIPETWLIMASTSADSEAMTGALTGAIAEAVATLSSGVGQKYGTNHRFFHVSDFLDTVRSKLKPQKLRLTYNSDWNAEHQCLPNPHYSRPDTVVTESARHDLALPTKDLATHWAPRAQGSHDGRWLFAGRADLMRQLIATVSSEDPGSQVTLITGGAGCGKSAVLARLVTLSDPAFNATHRDQVSDIPDDLLPPERAVDVAVLATGKYPSEVLDQIADALGAPRPEADRSDSGLDARIDACRDTLQTRQRDGRRATVVLDALDEAQDPIGIARMLARLAENTGLRMLIGLRSPDLADAAADSTSPGGTMAELIEKLLDAHRLRVDSDQWWHQKDVRDYALSILRHTPGSVYARPENAEHAAALAQVIADQVQKSFLVARLSATALTERSDLPQPDDAPWLATLSAGVVGVFRADLARIYPDPAERRNAIELLRAVAFAYGRGLPWAGIWPLVANAVANQPAKFGDRDIADLLASRISAYLTTDTEDGVTVYRLFHDALRGTLREQWTELLTESETDSAR